MISKNKKKGKSKMSKAEQENRIVVDHVYKTFNIYMDKANSLKEKLLYNLHFHKKTCYIWKK